MSVRPPIKYPIIVGVAREENLNGKVGVRVCVCEREIWKGK